MAHLLTNLMFRLIGDPVGARASLTCPQILWVAPARDSTDSGSWQLTSPGASLKRPMPGEALVYPVQKAVGVSNPFPMGITLGRVDSNDLVLDDISVSRFHAWLQLEERTHIWWLTDAESRNGTWVGGMKCEPRKRVALSDGCELRVGDAHLRFFTPEGLIAYASAHMIEPLPPKPG